MASSAPHWTHELPPLEACGLLLKLPALGKLREDADAAVRLAGTAAGASAAPGAELMFRSHQLYEAVRRCVEDEPGIAPSARPTATLLLASVAMEDYVRGHSTKARLVSSQFARIAREAAEQLAEASKAQADDDDAKLLEFLVKAGRDQVVDRLLRILNEPEASRPNMARVLAKRTPSEIAAILKATRRAYEGIIASKPSGPCAVVVVLVPSVILTTQHMAAFDTARLPRTLSAAFSSDNPLGAKQWRAICLAACSGGHHSVVVATADSFLNLLRIGKAMMEEVDLLVLDEAHHCKDDHPYGQLMEKFYNNRPPTGPAASARRPRLLAVTASPASERDKATLGRRMDELLGRLGARLHLVDGEDPGVAAVVPEATQIVRRVIMRSLDRALMNNLQSFALDAAMDIDESLAEAQAEGGTAHADKDALSQALFTAVSACETAASSPNQSLVTRLDALGQWLSEAREFAARYRCFNLDLSCRLLDVIRKSVELIEDAGFEGALPFLCRKAAVLCRMELKYNDGLPACATFRSRRVPPCPGATPHREDIFVAAVEVASAATAAAAGNGGGGDALRGRWPLPPLQHCQEPGLFAALEGAAAAMPSARDLVAAARVADTAVAAGGRCGDIKLRVSKLLKDLLMGDQGVLSAPEMGHLVPDCFLDGQLQEESTFPKFWELVKYLQGYEGREQFHGIIFVRTRQAVFHVTDMIRRTLQLQFLEVLELIGHNSTSKRTALASEEDRHGRGMSDTQQQQVLRLFKEPGRKVLVATSAAEEGLDVPSCEFVVRYNAAATGIQLLQSRGRARQLVAEFCAILQDGTLDTELHSKSRQEEANMHEWQRTVAALNRGTVLP